MKLKHLPYAPVWNESIHIRKSIAGLTQWLEQLAKEGWSVFQMSFLFRPLAFAIPSIDYMRSALGGFYSLFVTRVCRKPRAPSSDGKLPILLAFPDMPVFKRNRRRLLPHQLVNGGLHFGGLLIVPPHSRLRAPADEHFRAEQSRYLRTDTSLHSVRADPVYRDFHDAVDYCFKSAKGRKFFFGDHFLVFPRARGEIAKRRDDWVS